MTLLMGYLNGKCKLHMYMYLFMLETRTIVLIIIMAILLYALVQKVLLFTNCYMAQTVIVISSWCRSLCL